MHLIQEPSHKLMCILVLIIIEHRIALLNGRNKLLVIEGACRLLLILQGLKQVLQLG